MYDTLQNNTEPKIRETHRGKVVRNAFFNSGGWGLTVLIALVATPYFVHKLTLEGYGIYAMLTGLVGYYGLLDLGLGQGVIKFVSQFRAIGDHEAIARSINAALWVQVITGFLGSAALVVFAAPILRFLNVSEIFWDDTKIGLYVSAVGFFFTMMSGTLSSVLMGLQRYDITSKVNVTTNGILTLTIVGLLYAGYGLREIIYATGLSTIIVFSIFLVKVKAKLPHWKLSLVFDGIYFKQLFNFSGYMFVSKISSLFSNYAVRFIVSALLGPAAVTYYVVPMKIITAFSGLLSNITTVLFPFASELGAVDKRERLQRVFITALKYVTTIAFPVYLILILFSREILTVWMGSDFAAQTSLVMSLLALAHLLSSLTMVPSYITFGLGYSKTIAFFSMAALALGIVFVIPFAKYWGIFGVAGGILAAQIIEAPIFIIYTTTKTIRILVSQVFRNVLLFNVIIALTSLVIYLPYRAYAVVYNSFTISIMLMLYVLFYYGLSFCTNWIPYKDVLNLLKKSES